MIRSLRQHHRRIIVGLAIFLPIAVVGGIAGRKSADVPSLTSMSEMDTSPDVIWESRDLWLQNSFRTRLLTNHALKKHFTIEITAEHTVTAPDLLVYWSAGIPPVEALTDHAVMLGVFTQNRPVRLPLPEEFGAARGVLILYSLADHKVVAISKRLGVEKP